MPVAQHDSTRGKILEMLKGLTIPPPAGSVEPAKTGLCGVVHSRLRKTHSWSNAGSRLNLDVDTATYTWPVTVVAIAGAVRGPPKR
eukprot:1186997-Pyramimonas_sp.AAC.1